MQYMRGILNSVAEDFQECMKKSSGFGETWQEWANAKRDGANARRGWFGQSAPAR